MSLQLRVPEPILVGYLDEGSRRRRPPGRGAQRDSVGLRSERLRPLDPVGIEAARGDRDALVGTHQPGGTRRPANPVIGGEADVVLLPGLADLERKAQLPERRLEGDRVLAGPGDLDELEVVREVAVDLVIAAGLDEGARGVRLGDDPLGAGLAEPAVGDLPPLAEGVAGLVRDRRVGASAPRDESEDQRRREQDRNRGRRSAVGGRRSAVGEDLRSGRSGKPNHEPRG
jgi:hypothetical protein